MINQFFYRYTVHYINRILKWAKRFFFEVAKTKAVALSSSLTPKACPYPDVLRGEDNDVEEDVLRSHE
jgi:hypothetical protein